MDQYKFGTSYINRTHHRCRIGIGCPTVDRHWHPGQVFVSALKAIAPLLVAVLVMSSVAKARGGLGKRFRTVVSLYLLSTFIAALLAVTSSFLFPATLQLKDVAQGQTPSALSDVFTNLFTNMVANPLFSTSTANYIGILFWAIIFGLALKKKASQKTIDVIHDISGVVSLTVRWVIQFAPFGILGLVFASVSESGLEEESGKEKKEKS